MSPEPEREKIEQPYYFTQSDLLHRYPDLLPPKIAWQEMMERKEILSSRVLLSILRKAEEFLINEPGPNRERRRTLAPLWFGYWEKLIREKIGQREKITRAV